MTNADFEGGMSVPTAMFTKKGRAGIKDAYGNLGGNTKTAIAGAYQYTPMGVNRIIEDYRGSEQKFTLWKGDAVYKERGGKAVENSDSNNIGIANYPIDSSKVGQTVPKPDPLNEGGVVTKASQVILPFISDTALTHDKLASYLEQKYPNTPTPITNQGTILPAYIVNTYGLIGKPVNNVIDYFNNSNNDVQNETKSGK